MTAKRILAFGAHPDDVEFRCAGTLALLRDAGWDVGIATITGGCGGSTEHDREETRRIRLAEAAASAGILDAPYYYAGGEDMDVDFRHELRVKAVHVIREFRPDVVIACAPVDYHADHEEASRLVRAACFYAPIPNFPEQTLPPIPSVPRLYYMYARVDALGRELPVQFLVDISTVQETKAEMLACHASQRNWIRDHHGIDDYMERMRRCDAELGKRASVAAAEAFHQHLGDAYPHDNILGDALGEKIHIPAIGD